MNNWKTQLDNYGFTRISNQTEAQVKIVLNNLGNVIDETDVIANSKSKSLVTSDSFLDFHTDNHLAKYIVWHCKKPAKEGGISMLCNAQSVYNELNELEKIELSKIHVYEHKMFPENRNSNPIVREIEGKQRFYYSFWMAREKYRELSVFKKWQKLIQKADHVKLLLKKNDVLIIDNHRILHGRTKIKGERFLKRYWLSPDFKPTTKFYNNKKQIWKL